MEISTKINAFFKAIQLVKYKYKINYVGGFCTGCTESNDDGLCYTVYLTSANEGEHYDEGPYVNHILRINKDVLCCHEDIHFERKWYLNGEEFNYSIISEFHTIIDSIIKPYDFEHLALIHFDGDIVSESIPYGEPYCLVIDGCTFMIERDGNNYKEQEVRNYLKKHDWADERIDRAIKEGYEITPNVWDVMNKLPIKYGGSYDW